MTLRCGDCGSGEMIAEFYQGNMIMRCRGCYKLVYDSKKKAAEGEGKKE